MPYSADVGFAGRAGRGPLPSADVRMAFASRRITSLMCVALIGALLGLLAPEATCQPPTVRQQPLVIEGRVLWVDFGSQTMALAPANGFPVIVIDLHRIRQSDYHGFRGNEYARVVGFILRPNPRIQAFEIYLVSPWFPQSP
jgi:hypothetical protein